MRINSRKKIKNGYLEIYINNEGNLIVTPLNKATAPVIKKIFGTKKHLHSVYCG